MAQKISQKFVITQKRPHQLKSTFIYIVQLFSRNAVGSPSASALLRLPEFNELAPRSRQAFSASARPQAARWLAGAGAKASWPRQAGRLAQAGTSSTPKWRRGLCSDVMCCLHYYICSRRPEGSTNQAYSSCFYFRIS